MQPQIARTMFQVYEPIALVGFGAPELQTVCNQLGLGEHRMSYYAIRAAALGPVSADVVSSLFYHHTVEMVAPAIPIAWNIASPERIVEARFEAVGGALRRLLSERIQSAEVAEAVALIREALAACSTAGRPLFAAHASLTWPSEPHVALWHGANLLREHRGGGHISAVQMARLDPCQATLTLLASAGADPAGRRARWADEVWNQAVTTLQARGWLDDEGQPTDEGLAARYQVEDDTDALSLEPWLHLGLERSHRLWTLLRNLVQVILDQNGVVLRTPLGLSWPPQWPG